MAAVEDARIASRQLRAGDLATVEALIRQARTWALMDSLASDVAGAIALRDPSSWPRIDAWAGDGDFWCAVPRSWRCCRGSAPASRTSAGASCKVVYVPVDRGCPARADRTSPGIGAAPDVPNDCGLGRGARCRRAGRR